MSDELKCEHCGTVCEDDYHLEIFHRGCRLKAAFPDCYEADGSILKFDMKKVREQLDKAAKEGK